MGLDPRGKLAPGKGLRHVVVGAQLEPDRLVNLGVLWRSHDHRHLRALAQAPAHLGAWRPGEREIEQHQVRIGRLKRNRAVATRYDKLAVRYLATLHIAAINEWLRHYL